MNEPDDFGLSVVRTLAHVADTAPSPPHSVFWKRWREAAFAAEPALEPWTHGERDPGDPTAGLWFESVRSVRIGCTLVEPPDGVPVRAGLVTLHGYGRPARLAEDAERLRALAARGVAVLIVRVRGYPGSQVDAGDLCSPSAAPFGWISVGLDTEVRAPEDAMNWVLPQAVADAANACRALARRLRERAGMEAPIFLHGTSFGGGLAIVAASALVPVLRIDRIAVALPSLGDWTWRLEERSRCARGLGAEVWALLAANHLRRERIVETLRLCDAAVHATRVRCHALGMLAERDDTVPAPAAAGVFNALGADPGRRWRFVVPYGHFDGGIANARRHSLFERCLWDFLDPAKRPGESMGPWLASLASGQRGPGESARPGTAEQPALFEAGEEASDAALIGAYERERRTLDDLPYTLEFASLFASVKEATGLDERGVFHRLHNLRKAGRLPRLGRAATAPPRIDEREEALLSSLVVEAAGTLGQRDRLPYTPEFESLVARFNAETGRRLEPHTVWRLVARLAK